MSSVAKIVSAQTVEHAVALVDVDNTLSIFIDNDDKTLAGIKQSMRRHFRLNEGLITAMQQSGVHHLYLFTSMNAKEMDVMLRMALIDVLQEDYKLIVHGVLTPADGEWNLPQEPFYHEEDDVARMSALLEQDETDDEGDLLANSLQDNSIIWLDSSEKKFFPIQEASASPLGAAFQSLCNALKNQKLQPVLREYKNAVKNVIGKNKDEHKPNIKATIFRHFLQHNPGYKIVFVCDDNKDALLSVIDANQEQIQPINLNTIYVNNNLIVKEDPEQEKEFHAYHALFSLKLLCEAYLAKLPDAALDERDETVLQQKHEVLKALISALTPKEDNLTDTQKLLQFEEALNKNRESLLQSWPSQSGLAMTPVFLAEKLGVSQSPEGKLFAQLELLLANSKLDLSQENKGFQKKWKKVLDELREVIQEPNQYDAELKQVGKLIYTQLNQRYFMTSDERAVAISVAELTRISIIEPEKPEHFNAIDELSHHVPGQSDYWNILHGCLCALAGVLILSFAISLLVMTNGLATPLSLKTATVGSTLISQAMMGIGDLALLGVGGYALMGCWNFFANSEKKGLAKDLTLLGKDLKKHQKQENDGLVSALLLAP